MTIHKLIFKSNHPGSTDSWYAEVNEDTGYYRHIFHVRTTPENAWLDLAVHDFRNDHPEFAQAILDSARGDHDRLSRHWGYVACFAPEAKKGGLTSFLEKHS